MAQIQSPETYVDGQQVTASRLNNQTNGATLLPGAITDQPSITANTLEATDSTIVNDAGTLKEATIGDFLNSNLPITTSAVTAGNGNDIIVTPNDSAIVSGVAYTSANGLTVTVTSTAHTLSVGQVILVTLAGTGYNGTFRVATIATNSFTYVMPVAATAGSGSLSYTKQGLVRNVRNQSVEGSLFVDGELINNGFSGGLIPAGAVMSFAMNSAPNGWLICNGSNVSRTTYFRLFNAIGIIFGNGDGSTTFTLPDLRGEFIRGVDNSRGVDTGRAFGSAQADEFKSHTHTTTGRYMTLDAGNALGTYGGGGTYPYLNTMSFSGGSETRPRNIALLYCIKT